jgi:uncharacterized OB-fold protein
VINKKRKIPVREGLFIASSPADGKPRLVGGKCSSCGEIIFPKLEICPNCQEEKIEEITLSRRGKIYSYTVVMQQPRPYYKGPVPYGLGFVELPEGVRIETLFANCDPEALEIGDEVELIIDKLYDDDEGNELITYKFEPIKAYVGKKNRDRERPNK